MRILLTHRPGGAYGYISEAWLLALRDRGHAVQRWDGDTKSWDRFDPDVYCAVCSHRQNIPVKRRAKIAIHVNPYGPFHLPGISESPDNIAWTIAQRPDVVFGYGAEYDRQLWSYWTDKHGIPWVPMPTAGDRCTFHMTAARDSRQHDFVYVGGRWEYKAKSIDPYLLAMLKNTTSYVVHGWGDWPAEFNVTPISDVDVPRVLNSGKIGPCIAEPHTHQYGIDIPERLYKVALCGMLIVHDAVPAVLQAVPSAIVASSPEEFREICCRYTRDNMYEERVVMAERQRQEVLAHHTYHHRWSTLFSALGWPDAAAEMLD